MAAAAPPGAMSGLRVSTSIEEGDGQRTFHSIALEHVGGRYFETLGVPLVRGRTFTERDFTGGGAEDAREPETPVVINRTAEQRLFGAGTAVGRRLRADRDGRSYVVIGVVPDVRPSLRTADPMATAFVQIPGARFHSASLQGTTVLVRGTSDRGAMAAVREELRRTDPRLTIFDARTMDEHLERFERSIRIAVSPLAGLSLFGLVLATIGLTGVTSYAAPRRRGEIGIRMALGTERLHVLWLVLREGTFLVMAGAGIGAAGALAVARALSALDPDLAQILGTRGSGSARRRADAARRGGNARLCGARLAITSSEPARAASHLKGRSASGGGAKRLDSTGAEATPPDSTTHTIPGRPPISKGSSDTGGSPSSMGSSRAGRATLFPSSTSNGQSHSATKQPLYPGFAATRTDSATCWTVNHLPAKRTSTPAASPAN